MADSDARRDERLKAATPAIPVMLEHLETRQLLDAQFAGVGLVYQLDPNGTLGAETFITEGTVADDGGDATGQMFVSGRTGRAPDGTLPYDRIVNRPEGRFDRSPDRGRLSNPARADGAQFLRTDGVGWWFAERRRSVAFGTEVSQEIEYLVERPEAAMLSDLQGVWRFSLIGVDFLADEPFNGTGTLTFEGGTATWRLDFGSIARSTSDIETVGPAGQFISSDQEYFYLSRDGQSLVFTDMAERDDLIFTGVAVRADAAVPDERLAGNYLLSWAVAGVAAADIGGEGIGFAQRSLELLPNGNFRIAGLGSSGGAITTGRWSVSGPNLTLDVAGTDELLSFIVSDGGQTILGTDWDDGAFVDAVVGLGVRAGGPVITVVDLVVPSTTPTGDAAVYQLREGGQWYIAEIVEQADAPEIDSEFVAWRDDRDGRVYAAGSTAAGDVILFSQDDRALWTFRNLTQELADSGPGQRIIGDVSLMITPDNVANIVGLGPDGDVVRFFDTGRDRPFIDGSGFFWGVMNISDEQLTPGGVATPDLTGELDAFATSWGGLNIVGLDEAGRLWSVWWAPGLERWQATNFSETFGTPILEGGVTTLVTPWDGITIAGVDPDGELRVTWWVPQFGGMWVNNNLTRETGGPLLSPGDLASLVAPWGGLNIVGFAQGTGELLTYWWSPERTELGWAAASLSDIAVGAPEVLTGPISAEVGPGTTLNVFATTADDELVRLFWQPDFGGEWRIQNVHELAVVSG